MYSLLLSCRPQRKMARLYNDDEVEEREPGVDVDGGDDSDDAGLVEDPFAPAAAKPTRSGSRSQGGLLLHGQKTCI